MASHIPAIEARRLSVELSQRLVLDRVDLSLAPGEIVVVMGSNGAGKTTLLRSLSGLRRPTSGDVFWFGQSPRQSLELRRSIGMVTHQRALYGELTPRENLLFAAQLCDVSNAVARVEQLLSEAGIERHARLQTRQLSHGLQQRLALCRALVHDPPLLLLDEPSAGLDEEGQQWLTQLLLDLSQRGRAICLTTHERRLPRCLAGRVVRLEEGKLRLEEPARTEAA